MEDVEVLSGSVEICKAPHSPETQLPHFVCAAHVSFGHEYLTALAENASKHPAYRPPCNLPNKNSEEGIVNKQALKLSLDLREHVIHEGYVVQGRY